MRISLDWLSDYLPTSLSVAEIGERLTATGLEVEKSEVFDALPGGLRGIVVGEVREVRQHPNADRLRVTKVDVGAPEWLNIVCGASNVAEGQKVAVAKAGISERSGRRIEQSTTTPRIKPERDWRTRDDPLEAVWSTELLPNNNISSFRT